MRKIGTICKILEDGFGYVKGEDGNEYIFSFNTLNGYCGEYAKEYGIKEGSIVVFENSDDLKSKIKKILLVL